MRIDFSGCRGTIVLGSRELDLGDRSLRGHGIESRESFSDLYTVFADSTLEGGKRKQ